MLESYRQRNLVRNGSLPMVLGSALALMCSLFSGCSPSQSDVGPLKSLVRKNCTVFFRHDVLGQADSMPSNFEADVINGAPVSVTGKLVTGSDEWILIETESKRLYIPRSNVLFISSSEK